SSLYIKVTNREDPKEIVIDEVVGQMLTNGICFFSFVIISNSVLTKIWTLELIEIVFLFFLPFLLFRIFDIFKPWPINWLDENIGGGFGIMLDDILAAIFASIAYFVIVFLVINIISRL
ncbi:MAG: phosphatidylglycerophosphatase A family protein, partial [Janthinobacterium lividum]